MQPRLKQALLGVAVVLTVVVVFRHVPAGDFLDWDDGETFLENYDFRGLGAAQLAWAFRTSLTGNFQPFSWLAFEAQYSLFGLDPHAFHAVSVGLHALVTLGVFALALRLAGERARAGVCAAAALLFGLHPLRVEVVAWSSCQQYLWCSLFIVAALLAYVEAARADGWRRRGWLGGAFGAMTVALLFKAIATTVPALFVLLDLYPLGRWRTKRAWVEKVPFVALSGVFAALAMAARRAVEHQVQAATLSVWERLADSALALGVYAQTLLWPFRLSSYYAIPRPLGAVTWDFLALVPLGVVGLAVAWGWWRRWPAVAVGVAAFLVGIGPNLGLVQFSKQLAADRYTYVGSLVLAALVGARGAATAVKEEKKSRRKEFLYFRNSFLLLLLVAFGFAATQRVHVWHDSLSLWTDAVAFGASSNADAHNNLGIALYKAGDLAAAEREFVRAVELSPNLANPYSNLGMLRFTAGRYAEATELFRKAVHWDPDLFQARLNLGRLLLQQGDLAGARTELEEARKRRPTSPEANATLAKILVRTGHAGDARPLAEAALKAAPNDSDTHVTLGDAHYLLGDRQAALREFQTAQRLAPDTMEPYYNIAQLLAEAGQLEQSVPWFEQAAAHAPTPAQRTAVEDHVRSLVAAARRVRASSPAPAPAGSGSTGRGPGRSR